MQFFPVKITGHFHSCYGLHPSICSCKIPTCYSVSLLSQGLGVLVCLFYELQNTETVNYWRLSVHTSKTGEPIRQAQICLNPRIGCCGELVAVSWWYGKDSEYWLIQDVPLTLGWQPKLDEGCSYCPHWILLWITSNMTLALPVFIWHLVLGFLQQTALFKSLSL